MSAAVLTRRAALTGAVAMAAAVAAAPASCAITPAAPTGISPALMALIAAVDPAKEAVETHQRDVLDVPAFAHQDADAKWRECQHNNDLNDAWVNALDRVAVFPVSTGADLHAKLVFMVENEMGDGRDWLEELLTDAARLAKLEGRA